jgi:hypothetical protein
MNISISAMALFILCFMLIAIENKKEEGILPKADFLITMEWNPKSKNDIDLWVKDPDGNILSFTNKSVQGMFLDRDDLGKQHDVIITKNGQRQEVEINQEIVTIRGYKAGKYTVAAHYYGNYGTNTLELVTISVLKLQPFNYVFRKNDIELRERGQEVTLVTFELDSDGKVIGVSDEKNFFVNRSAR